MPICCTRSFELHAPGRGRATPRPHPKPRIHVDAAGAGLRGVWAGARWGRGGGPQYLATLSQPAGSVQGWMRVTVQVSLAGMEPGGWGSIFSLSAFLSTMGRRASGSPAHASTQTSLLRAMREGGDLAVLDARHSGCGGRGLGLVHFPADDARHGLLGGTRAAAAGRQRVLAATSRPRPARGGRGLAVGCVGCTGCPWESTAPHARLCAGRDWRRGLWG